MDALRDLIHGEPDRGHGHSHNHGGAGHSHGHEQDSGFRLMNVLSVLQRLAHSDTSWLTSYRPSRLIPASNRVIIGTIAVLAIGVVLWHILPNTVSGWALALAIAAAAHLGVIVIGGLAATLFLRHQRSQLRNNVLNSITWRGDEQVLDVACGAGMLLNGAALRLTTGKAVGIDIYQPNSGGGTLDLLLENARAEGVANKIEFREMDARQLAFGDSAFDVVTSSLALHHIGNTREETEQTITEIIRVLKPGGYLSLVDVPPMIEIAEGVMKQSGLKTSNVKQGRFFRFVTARKS